MQTRIARAYGVESPTIDVFPAPLVADKNPSTKDIYYEFGQVWINKTTGQSWMLVKASGGTVTWTLCSPGASDVDTINGLSPVAGNIVVAGGTNLTDVNGGNTVTLNLDPAITLATSVTSPIYTAAAALDINAAAGSDITIQLGDAAGANVLDIEDSASATVASIDSNGIATFVGMDGVLGGVTPATATATTITANTSVTSPLFTAAAADAVVQAGGVNDVVLRLGDAAGATFLRVQDSTTADVFTIDSVGTLGAMAGLTVTGALTQTAGVVSIAQDNAADAVDIAGGNVARAITLGATGAHTLNIGNAAAGAIAIDTAAGVSIDAATASNVTVTGAGQDLTVSSVGGSVVIDGSEAAVDAVRVISSDAAGGIDIDSGTGGIDIQSTGVFSIDGAAASNVSVAGAGIDLSLESAAGRVVINGEEAAADAVRVLSAAGGLDANVALQMNLDSSQAAADAVRIISSNAAGGIDIDSGTAGIAIDSTGAFSIDGAAASDITVTGAFDLTVQSTAGSTIVTSGEAAVDAVYIHASDAAGGVSVVSGTAGIIADTTGNIELNSSAGTILIGDDDIDQNIELGTDGERTVTVGSTNGAAALVLQAGTGEITVTGTVKEIDAEFLYHSGDDIVFQSDPICQIADGTYGVPAGATGEVDNLLFQEGVCMQQYIIGAGQTILAPTMDANGLLASLDLTVGEGVEYNFGADRANSRHAFTIGTSPAFFMELRFRINDMDGADPYIFGFRRSAANNATWENYTDYAAIGMNAVTSATEIVIADELNGGGTTLTNTTDLWGGDGSTNTLQVLVSAAGVTTYTINGAAPTATHAFTFDNGDVVVPFIRLEHSASPTAVNLISMKIGYQA